MESQRLKSQNYAGTKVSASTLATARHIIRREGIGGLYNGLASALFGISVTNFVYYYWYEYTRLFLERAALRAGRLSQRLTTLESMLCGALAGAATVLVTNPIWVINTRMTASNRKDKQRPSTFATLKSLLRHEGFAAFFAGVMPALVLVTNPILQYTVFEKLKELLQSHRSVAAKDIFILGALSKLAATTITYPYITVKSRMHVARSPEEQQSTLATLQRLLCDEGWAGLYRGGRFGLGR